MPFVREVDIGTPGEGKGGAGFGLGKEEGEGEERGFFDFTGTEGQGVRTSASMGGYLTAVYEAMRSGELYQVVGECLREGGGEGRS